jgi:hypothetical protein
MASIVSNSSASGAGESKRCSTRLQNLPSPPLAVFCGLTVDRSGSMSNIFITAAGGVYNCIQDQIKGAQENGQIGHLFLTTFDDHITEIYKNANFKDLDIKKKDVLEWMTPRGCTKLYDTAIQDLNNIMIAVKDYKESLSAEVKKLNPTISTVWVCCTDGHDNTSEATCEDFKNKVKEAKKAGIQCIFIAANQDAVMTGSRFGFDKGSSMTFGANNVGAAQAFRSVSNNMRQATSSGLSVPFTKTQRLSSLGTTSNDTDSDDGDNNGVFTVSSPPKLVRSRNYRLPNLRQPAFN